MKIRVGRCFDAPADLLREITGFAADHLIAMGLGVPLDPHDECGARVIRDAVVHVEIGVPVPDLQAAIGRACKSKLLAQILSAAVALLRYALEAQPFLSTSFLPRDEASGVMAMP